MYRCVELQMYAYEYRTPIIGDVEQYQLIELQEVLSDTFRNLARSKEKII